MMKQVELHAPEDVRVIEVPRPEAGPGELLLKIACVGICGSDLHAYHGKHPFIELPVVPGHEFAGTVEAVGEDVVGFEPGERVTVEPSLVCGECYNCAHGRYNICANLRVIGCQTTGALGEYLAVPADMAYHLPEEMTWDQAALIEPLAVAVHAVRVAELPPGAGVLILGAGTIGLMTLQAAKAMGAGRVLITDLLPERRELAYELGADLAVDPAEVDLRDVVEVVFGHERADVIFECVGVEATARAAIELARKGSRIVLAGVFEDDVSLPFGLVQDWELEIVGTLMYAHADFPVAIGLLDAGKVRAEPLITDRFPLEQAAEAFAVADGREGALKVLIDVSSE